MLIWLVLMKSYMHNCAWSIPLRGGSMLMWTRMKLALNDYFHKLWLTNRCLYLPYTASCYLSSPYTCQLLIIFTLNSLVAAYIYFIFISRYLYSPYIYLPEYINLLDCIHLLSIFLCLCISICLNIFIY